MGNGESVHAVVGPWDAPSRASTQASEQPAILPATASDAAPTVQTKAAPAPVAAAVDNTDDGMNADEIAAAMANGNVTKSKRDLLTKALNKRRDLYDRMRSGARVAFYHSRIKPLEQFLFRTQQGPQAPEGSIGQHIDMMAGRHANRPAQRKARTSALQAAIDAGILYSRA